MVTASKKVKPSRISKALECHGHQPSSFRELLHDHRPGDLVKTPEQVRFVYILADMSSVCKLKSGEVSADFVGKHKPAEERRYQEENPKESRRE